VITASTSLNGQLFGSLIGNSTGYHLGDVKGSIFGDDSTVLVDSANSELVGPVRNLTLLGQTGNTPVDNSNVNQWIEVTVNGLTRYIPLYV
jgi:hypothetical protein